MEYLWILLSVFLQLTFHPGKTFALDAPLLRRQLVAVHFLNLKEKKRGSIIFLVTVGFQLLLAQ